MVTIYNDPRYVYGTTTTANTNTIAVNGGNTIDGNSFVSPGTYTVTQTSTASYPRVTLSWEGNKMANTPTAFEIAEALFVLKPKLRKKYKNCADALLNDIIAAADGKNSWNAAQKLGSVLGLED